MARPDLDTPEGRAAYRSELRRVGWKLRLGGFVFIVVAAVILLTLGETNKSAVAVSYGMLAAGWVLVITAIFQRTRYHKRRMAEGL
jgi:hypothetical protein